MPTRACHPSAWLKVEAVCKHFLFVASDERPRQKLLQAASSGMAMAQNKGCKTFKGLCSAPPPSVFLFFFTACQKFLSRPSRSDVIDYFFPCGAKANHSHKQKVLARAYGRLKILRGESGGGHAPFSCAPCSAQAPPATPVRLRGRACTSQ